MNKKIIAVDLFKKNKNNYNLSILGQENNYILNDIMEHYAKENTKIYCFIDQKNIAQENFEGKTKRYIFSDKSEICINPFTIVEIDENLKIKEEEVLKITKLIKEIIYPDNILLKKAIIIDRILTNAINIAFEKHNRNTGFSDVYDEIIEYQKNIYHEGVKYQGNVFPRRIEKLDEFIILFSVFSDKKSSYYNYFNGENNLTLSEQVNFFDFEYVKNEKLKEAIISTILNQVENKISLENRNNQNIVVFEDIDSIFENQHLTKKIIKYSEDISKYNASMIISLYKNLTLLNNEYLKYYINNASINLFFKNEMNLTSLLTLDEILSSAINNLKIESNNKKIVLELLKSEKEETSRYFITLNKVDGYVSFSNIEKISTLF